METDIQWLHHSLYTVSIHTLNLMTTEKFDQWCLLELFGHQKLAGRVSESQIAGGNFLRVDVPETASNPSFTRIINPSAIYAINPITEEVARPVRRDHPGCAD